MIVNQLAAARPRALEDLLAWARPWRLSIACLLVALSVLTILLATLSPFDFRVRATLEGNAPIDLLGEALRRPSSADDLVNNLFLFMPLGFGLGLLHRRSTLSGWAALRAVLLGAALSATVELLQIFLPTRNATGADVLTNSTGTAIGWLCWALLWLSLRSTLRLKLGLALYLLLALGLTFSLQYATRLQNWDERFPLLVGNEQSGDRPWRGQLFALDVADRALSAAELDAAAGSADSPFLASYRVSDGVLRDRLGNLPDLVWHQGQQPAASGEGILLDGKHWLSTGAPATSLSQRLAASSQFTLRVTAASAGNDQSGPARIVSLSSGTDRRNFTLGQQGDQLVFRLRTPGTGSNGVYPQLVVPGVFSDSRPRELTITYDGVMLALYVDGELSPYALQLTTDLALFMLLLPPELRLLVSDYITRFGGSNDAALYMVLYYSLVCIPAGLLLALLARREASRYLAAAGGAVLVVLVFAWGPALLAEQQVSLERIGVALTLIFGSWGLFSWLARPKTLQGATAG